MYRSFPVGKMGHMHILCLKGNIWELIPLVDQTHTEILLQTTTILVGNYLGHSIGYEEKLFFMDRAQF